MKQTYSLRILLGRLSPGALPPGFGLCWGVAPFPTAFRLGGQRPVLQSICWEKLFRISFSKVCGPETTYLLGDILSDAKE